MISSPVSAPVSTEKQKKIKGSFFKENGTVKAYKCYFKGPDIETRAKIYISFTAIHIVHRPKRRKLTTIPFSIIRSIQANVDQTALDIHLKHGPNHSLQRFERPATAVAFILAYWDMLRKELAIARHSSMNNDPQQGSSESVGCDTPGNSRPHLSVPTTVSLVSSASLSDSESSDSLSPLAKPSICSRSSELQDVSSSSLKSSTSGLPSSKAIVNSTSTSLESASLSPSVDREQCSKSISPSSRVSEVDTVSPGAAESSVTRQRISSVSAMPPRPTSTSKARANSCISEAVDWLVWPLSLLPCPLSSPNQRFTMAIAYVILAFLFCSTLHLYHRLAVFNGDRPLAFNSAGHMAHKMTPSELRDHLSILETDLSKLVGLAEQLTHALAKLTSELQQSKPTHTIQPRLNDPTGAGQSVTFAAQT